MKWKIYKKKCIDWKKNKMAYAIKKTKVKEKKSQIKNSYFVDGKDMSQVPIYYLEGDYGLTEKQEIALWQYGVDTGQVWHLQGWYGRNAQAMIDAGILHYPKKHSGQSSTDYYGNPIPTHKEAEEKGIYKERKKKAEMQRQIQGAFE